MSKYKKPTLQEYDGGAEDKPEVVKMDLLAIAELIEQLMENKPKTRDKNIWREYRKSVNLLVEEYNDRVGFKCFSHVH